MELTCFITEINLEFNQFIVRDEEPLLCHTGIKGISQIVKESVAKLIDPSTLR
jgi:flavorubredoxin